MLFLALRC